jgi:hypothetical protein
LRGECYFKKKEERGKMEEKIKSIEKRIAELKTELEILEKEREKIIENQQIEIWKKRRDEGWIPFIFYSSYYGTEYNTDGSKFFYVFSPVVAVNIEKFKKMTFAHGDHTMEDTNKSFESFIDSLEYSDYDFLDDYIIQAVWPELYNDWKKI